MFLLLKCYKKIHGELRARNNIKYAHIIDQQVEILLILHQEIININSSYAENADFYCTIYSFETLYMSAPDSSFNSGYTNWSYRDLHTSLLRPTPTIDKPRTTVSLNVGLDVTENSQTYTK